MRHGQQALLIANRWAPWALLSPRCLSGVTEPAMVALDAIHVGTGLPWWATLATSGAAVRLGLYPLTRKARQATSVVVSAFRQAQMDTQLQARMQTRTQIQKSQKSEGGARDGADATVDRKEVIRRARELLRSHPSKTSPIWMVCAPLAQVSVLVYALYCVRYMAKTGWSGFSVGGPTWAVDLTLPAVDVATMTTPLGVQGIAMPAALLGGFMMSISRVRPRMKKDGQEFSEDEQVQRWALGHMSMLLEVLTIPLFIGALTSPQAPLYYWTSSMLTSLGMSSAMDHWDQHRHEHRSKAHSGSLSREAQGLLQRAAENLARGENDKALVFLKQAQLLAPEHPSVHMALGDVLASLPGREAAAIQHYRVAMETAVAVDDGANQILSQRATFALGMLLSRDGTDATKQEALALLERAASEMRHGDAFKPVAVRALLAIAAITDDKDRRRDALSLAKSTNADVADMLSRKKRGPRQ